MRVFRTILIVVVAMASVVARGQYVSINYDAATIAAMEAAYSAEAESEAYYNNQVQKILKHYKSAEVAAAGIFASKFLDRKALTDLGIWASPTENYYYKRIYETVSRRIIPKIWIVTKMLMKEPQQIFYWGTYIFKVTQDIQALCKQFEMVVTNSRLGFSDIAFPVLAPQLAALLDLKGLGDVDWSVLLHELADVADNFTAQKFKQDFQTLYKNGVELGKAGVSKADEKLMEFVQGDKFKGTLEDKIEAAINLADNAYTLYRSVDEDALGTLNDLIGADSLVTNLLKPSLYNTTSWVNDYANELQDRTYYTQRWYIHYGESRHYTVVDYVPNTSMTSIAQSPEWIRIATTRPSYSPSSSELKLIQENSENYAGITESYVNQQNKLSAMTGTTYKFYKSLMTGNVYRNGQLASKAFAYSINVEADYNRSEVVYEAVFNSFTMDFDTFMAQMEARLQEFNYNEEGKVYTIASDRQQPYQVADYAKLQGSKSATISVTCSDYTVLAEGSTQYKCKQCGKSVDAHTKECAMKTTLPDDGGEDETLDVSEIREQEAMAQEHIQSLQSEIAYLQSENNALSLQADTLSREEAAPILALIESNNEKIAEISLDLATWQKNLKDIQSALKDNLSGEQVKTDEYTRIPSIMAYCEDAYELDWNGTGYWSGNTFYRTASMKDINGTITFAATVSIARKPKYFLGIKIHRAIVQITWDLTSDYSDTQVVDVVELDPSADPDANAKIVNEHIADVASAYPGCSITTEYNENDPQATDDTDDTYHLLWSSDRLEIARLIDVKIHKIYADLIILERFLHYKHSWLDLLKDMGPYIDVYHGRRYTLFENCRRAWLKNAATATSRNNYRGEWDEPLEDDRFSEQNN